MLRRLPSIYFVLIPALTIAAGVLGYYTYLTASRFARLNEEAIAASSMLLAREKVENIERYVIQQDNTVFTDYPLDDPDSFEERWRPTSIDVTPSVRSVLLLNEHAHVVGFASRAGAQDRRDFLDLFLQDVVQELELDDAPLNRLKHLHGRFRDRSHLFSYMAVRHEGRRMFLVAHHDTGFIVRSQFPTLFSTEEGRSTYNVVDIDNRRVYGASLASAGDYVVGHRFPTTLYQWRLQIAPQQATQLETQGRSGRTVQLGSLGLSFAVILMGIAFLLYAASKERRLNEMKSEFIANVSHELKTPLSVVRMFGEMLLTERVRTPEKQKQYLEIICRESERLSGLIENVLDFAALERGKQKYDFHERDIGPVLAQAIDAFRYRLEEDGKRVTLELAENLPMVAIDEQSIVLAVVNLLDNAVKYGEGSAIEVSVTCSARSVHVRVRDHGPGIPIEDLRRIFERFYRTARHREVRGSGIGLALVKHIADAHGGRAWAANAEDGGAVVAFTLPAV
ncbi:MAG: HAMP domain-containing histidine kinase [Myxococcales bacterium]|nr:HAMP domain-containing histidine kinase [Myxococcales bacterium]MCB9626221.1 HAMP domain-containing histidine kinase [Sandaracinaceae bacterium]